MPTESGLRAVQQTADIFPVCPNHKDCNQKRQHEYRPVTAAEDQSRDWKAGCACFLHPSQGSPEGRVGAKCLSGQAAGNCKNRSYSANSCALTRLVVWADAHIGPLESYEFFAFSVKSCILPGRYRHRPIRTNGILHSHLPKCR